MVLDLCVHHEKIWSCCVQLSRWSVSPCLSKLIQKWFVHIDAMIQVNIIRKCHNHKSELVSGSERKRSGPRREKPCLWGLGPDDLDQSAGLQKNSQITGQGTKIFQFCTCPAGRVTYNFHSSCKPMHLSLNIVCN